MKNRNWIRICACAALALGGSVALCGEIKDAPDVKVVTGQTDSTKAKEAAAPQTAPATQPAKASVSPEAQTVLDDVTKAYGALRSLQLVGEFSGHFSAAGQESGGKIPFTATFQAPNKFRHTGKDDVLIGSTGDKAYAYATADNVFAQADSPKDKVATKDLPIGFRDQLSIQDPSLRLALAKDPGAEILEGVKDVSKVDDVKIGDASYPSLKLTLNDDVVLTLAVDPTTHLIRRTKLDLRAKLQSQKIPNIKEAFYSVDYTTTTPDVDVKDDQFAWAPPAGAKDIKDMKAGGDEEKSAATELVGKDVPDFKLAGLDGKTVSKADLKGKVYILDFWATWCGPCKASLPHLSELYKDEKEAGLIIYAVNCSEDKGTVAKFVDETKLGVPVLLDSDGKAAETFKAEGIPETVVVGKDGKVTKVLVGFDPSSTPDVLKKAVEEALKK